MDGSSSTKDRADNLAGAVAAILSMALALSLGDALIKFTSGEFVIWQIFVLRSLVVLPVLFLLMRAKVPEVLTFPPALGWTIIRSLMLVGMWVAYYVALPHMKLSIAAAAYYTLPIFITLFSAILVGDKIGRTGWLAVCLGFVGVLLILRPSADDFNGYVLLPLISAVLYALAMILTRTKCRIVHPFMLSLNLNIAFVVVGTTAAILIDVFVDETRSGFILAPWASMGGAEWVSMGLLASAIFIGSVGAAFAYQNGPPSILGTFDFSYVGFALVWGFVFFAEVPDLLSFVGMALIVGAGILSLRQ